MEQIAPGNIKILKSQKQQSSSFADQLERFFYDISIFSRAFLFQLTFTAYLQIVFTKTSALITKDNAIKLRSDCVRILKDCKLPKSYIPRKKGPPFVI